MSTMGNFNAFGPQMTGGGNDLFMKIFQYMFQQMIPMLMQNFNQPITEKIVGPGTGPPPTQKNKPGVEGIPGGKPGPEIAPAGYGIPGGKPGPELFGAGGGFVPPNPSPVQKTNPPGSVFGDGFSGFGGDDFTNKLFQSLFGGTTQQRYAF